VRRALALFVVATVAPCCATLASSGVGDRDLPSSGVGPFRKLEGAEVPGIAPFVLDDRLAWFREPAVLPLDDDPSSARVAMYAVAREAGSGRDVVVRSRAEDGRSFFGTSSDSGHAPPVVLRADRAWEGAGVRSPSALRVGAHVYVYYASDGGIGVAVSDDGLAFDKRDAPVLAPDDAGAPAAPSVAIFPDGTWHMLYAAGVAIAEATSADGVTWTRRGIVLAPAPPVDPAALVPGEKPPFDSGQVTDPCLVPRITPAGRLHVRVLYTGYDAAPGAAARASAIGFAARFGDDGALERQPLPVYAVGKHEAAPALFAWGGAAFLYVHQDRAATPSDVYPAVAAALAPATLSLAPPASFAGAP
jgi:hypothetical protein